MPRAPTKKKDRKAAQRGPKAGKKTTLKAAARKAPLGEGMVRQAPTEQTVPADQRPTITTILWTIYLNPADAYGQAVLRPHACLRDGRVLAVVLREHGHAAEHQHVIDAHAPAGAARAEAELAP